jgi:hypothetical protein
MQRTVELYFQQAICYDDIGLGDIPEADLPSERAIKRQLVDWAKKQTQNRLTGFEFDGWTLYFKEVVETAIDYDPWFLLCDHEETWHVRPSIAPENHNCTTIRFKK